MDQSVIAAELYQVTEIYQLITEFVVTYSFQILGGIIVIILGWLVGGKLSSWTLAVCERKQIDVTLAQFAASSVKLLVIVIFLIISLGKIGISIAPFVAALGAVSLGVGLALQGPLSNYGAGVTIILTRPFVVGDTISLGNITGVISQVKLAYTVLHDEDGVKYTIPNKKIVGEIIANSHAETLVELVVEIAYDSDTVGLCRVLKEAVNSVLKGAEARKILVGIEAFGESGIVVGVRLWAPTKAFYETKYAANQAILSCLQEQGISIPYPQREVRMHT
jgi:small conductance mechanosensitive channel